MNLTDRDLDVLARTIYGEARGEPPIGQRAIAHVILNRTLRPGRFGFGVIGVCLKRAQFSCWNDEDPNRLTIMSVQYTAPQFLRCVAAAAGALAGENDPTNGADHYHTVQAPANIGNWPPSWATQMTRTITLGSHVFYRE